ncbi:SulP family inorganic anion transporter [Paenibacillus hodogayensis]|uniref:SulP family inorganic anion transporter n=1 Tax=Paenibacillus hodogayensis TaxID=279208 RepID=A0ABV5W899_9BACL
MRGSGRFEGYSIRSLRRDLLAGTIVGVVAIPLAMSFAIASGVKPQLGLYTAIVAGFLIALFGGSRFQIGGPTGAFVPVLLGIVLQYGYAHLLLAGMMAGVILLVMGLLKLGAWIQFIPKPVVVGFTSGIAVIIFTGQIANFLGLDHLPKHERFWATMQEIVTHLASANLYSIITAAISLTVLLVFPKLFPKLPASLAGLVASTVVAASMFKGKLATIGSAYGAIPDALPTFAFPPMSLDLALQLFPSALVIALLGGIESLLSAVVADGMTDDKHRSNRELVGQGIANIVAPLFGGIPATGAIARTATNIKSGAVSPFSGMIHALVVLLVLVLGAPLASAIPLAGMAPILMLVAWNMSERKTFARLIGAKTGDSLVAAVTFALTVLIDLPTAVAAGLGLAILLFVKRMRDVLTVRQMLPDPAEPDENGKGHLVTEGRDCPQIAIYTVEGPLFFGSASLFEARMIDELHRQPHVLLLRLGKVSFVDASGAAALEHIVKRSARSACMVLVSGISPGPKSCLKKHGLVRAIGESRFFDHTGDAVRYALGEVDANRCLGCRQSAFRECAAWAAGDGQKGVARAVSTAETACDREREPAPYPASATGVPPDC